MKQVYPCTYVHMYTTVWLSPEASGTVFPAAALLLRPKQGIRDREPGKGNNPPAWQGGYLEETEGDWFAASGDLRIKCGRLGGKKKSGSTIASTQAGPRNPRTLLLDEEQLPDRRTALLLR